MKNSISAAVAFIWFLPLICISQTAESGVPSLLQLETSSGECHSDASKEDAVSLLQVSEHKAVHKLVLGRKLVVNASRRQERKRQPCDCQHTTPTWTSPTRTTAKCIFIDLGAADGNTFQTFRNDGYGPVKDCGNGSGDYEAFLVEANPHFSPKLQELQSQYPGKVHSLASTAAFMCEGQTSFLLDDDQEHNYWASSMGRRDEKMVKVKNVTVPTTNLIRLLHENTIPGDWVLVKMDIEGAEWDILPCLAEDPVAKRISQLLVEEHPKEWSFSDRSGTEIEHAKEKMKAQGVDIPFYETRNTF